MREIILPPGKIKIATPNPPKDSKFTNRLLNCVLILLPIELAKSPDITLQRVTSLPLLNYILENLNKWGQSMENISEKVRMLTIIQIGSKGRKTEGEFLPGNRGRYIIISFLKIIKTE